MLDFARVRKDPVRVGVCPVRSGLAKHKCRHHISPDEKIVVLVVCKTKLLNLFANRQCLYACRNVMSIFHGKGFSKNKQGTLHCSLRYSQ